jgi:signal transduction histidine kinase
MPVTERSEHVLIENLPTAVLVVSDSGVVLQANLRACEVLGSHARPGCQIAEILAPLQQLKDSVGVPSSTALNLPGPGNGSVGFRVAQVQGEDGRDLYLIVFQDISGVQRLRDERDRLLQLAAVGETLPAVLHEIKNPLAAISTAVEVLMEELSEGHVLRELGAILGEVRRIKLALEGVGLFRNDLHVRRASAIDRGLREAFLVIEPQFRSKGITADVRLPDLPLLELDVAVVRAFLFNLLSNAVQACSQGDRIRVEARLHADANELELVVADTGCGMSPETLARCRELFFTTKSNGSGIGLALVVTTIERAGGHVTIESELGKGTTVTLRMPILNSSPPSRSTGEVARNKINPQGGNAWHASKN